MINEQTELVDLRSDTVTLPTEEMREAMYRAKVGDSMRGEDPTMNELEALAAEKLGKEAAIYVPSGTMGNLVCLMTHTEHGDEVIFEPDQHSFYYEVGAYASIGGLSPRLVNGKHGVMNPVDIEAAIRPPSLYFPKPRLIVIENTHNRGGGSAIRLEDMKAMTDVARKHDLFVHLDGARVFNAAIALGVDAKEIASFVDSIQFCLSKGLSAPVGSMVVGSHEFIQRAKKIRKMLGGDLRQSGVLAAAGIIALEKMVDRLAEDHQNAAMLAKGLKEISGIVVDTPPIPTNMVFIDTTKLGVNASDFISKLEEHEVLAIAYATYRVRLVTHRHITAQDVQKTIAAVRKIALEI